MDKALKNLDYRIQRLQQSGGASGAHYTTTKYCLEKLVDALTEAQKEWENVKKTEQD